MNNDRKPVRRCNWLAALLLCSAQTVCAQQTNADLTNPARPVAKNIPAASPGRYEVHLFELIDAGRADYDPAFAGQLKALVAPQLTKQKNFLDRLTSGPTARGRPYAVGRHKDARTYIYYGICQAHQCNNTTIDLLFDPAHKRMVGQLLDGCTMRWLGRPNAEEMAALEQRHRESFPATETACKDRQAPAPGSRQGMHRSKPD